MPQPLNTAVDTPNYIRIRRGTPNAYKRLRYKDSNTLYFITEKDATTGLLYMGDKLIAGGDTSESTSAQIKLKDLADVIAENVGNNDLLVYDTSIHAWKNVSIENITQVVSPMIGATEELDGTAGLVIQPKAGDQDKLLHGNGTWDYVDIEYPTVGNLAHVKAKIEDLQRQVGSLNNSLEERVQTIENFMEIRNNVVTGAPVSILVNKVSSLQDGLAVVNQDITNIKLQLTWQPYDN